MHIYKTINNIIYAHLYQHNMHMCTQYIYMMCIFLFVLVLCIYPFNIITVIIFFPTAEAMSQEPSFKLLQDPTGLVPGWSPLLTFPLHELGMSNSTVQIAAKPQGQGYRAPSEGAPHLSLSSQKVHLGHHRSIIS